MKKRTTPAFIAAVLKDSEQMTNIKTAAKHGISSGTVAEWRKLFGMPRKECGTHLALPQWKIDEIVRNFSIMTDEQNQIATGVSHVTILKYKKRLGISGRLAERIQE